MAAFYLLDQRVPGEMDGLPTNGTLYRAARLDDRSPPSWRRRWGPLRPADGAAIALRAGGSDRLLGRIATEIALLPLVICVPAFQGVFDPSILPQGGCFSCK
jgi:hypothetical protein